MTRILRIGAAQSGPIQKDQSREVVIARLLELMKEAHGRGCDLVVFTELALTTFFPRYFEEDPVRMDAWFETEMPNPVTRPLFDFALQQGIGFALGYAEKTPEGRHFNTSILVDKSGAIVGKYRKVHLPGHAELELERRWQHLEKRYFEPGDLGFPVWRTMNAVMGMCICNDRRWPETFRVMGLQGAELVMLGYNTPTLNSLKDSETAETRMHHNHLCMQAGAYQNACWVVGAAKAGDEDGYDLMAGSCIINPDGEIVALANTTEDELISFDCDLDECTFLKRTTFNFAAHRRVEHYGRICSQTGAEPPPE
jgi:predicted amidohydrolase|tara:strand:+ start:119 stop:1051 length:933 start_codon:yes stop_codon:yes gene_type:complete